MKIMWQLFISFLKVGTFSFGGGLAMLPLIRKEVVEVHRWLEDKEMIDCFALSQSLPGVLSLNAAIYVGNRTKGIAGSLAAAAGVILPAYLSIIAILLFLKQVEDNIYVLGAFDGIKAATVGLILVTAFSLGKKMLIGPGEAVIAAISFLVIVIFGISAVWAIIFGGATGYILYVFKRAKKAKEDIFDADKNEQGKGDDTDSKQEDRP